MQYINRQNALAAGAVRYFTGKPCVHGHIAERFARGGHCVACGIARSNRRYELQGDVLKAQRMERYRADPDENVRRSTAWAAQNKDKVAAAQRRWRYRNPDKRIAWEHQRLARKLAAAGNYAPMDILALLASQAARCNNPRCQIDVSNCYTVDHVIPLTRGGSNWPSNLQLLCQPCNSSKGNRTMSEWITRQNISTPRHLQGRL